MIRSTKVTTKYANLNKIESIDRFCQTYSRIVQEIIDYIWEFGYVNSDKTVFNSLKRRWKIDSKLDNSFLKQFDNGLFSQRMLQACGTQASSILRSCTIKNKQRKYVISKLMKEKKNSSKLQSITDKEQISVPRFRLIQPQLDSRFFDIIEYNGGKEFDEFIQLRLFKNSVIRVPLNKHKKMIELENKGVIQNSIRLSKDYISLSYEIPEVEKKSEGTKVGADQGSVTCLSMSDGQVTKKDKHGHDLHSIMESLQRKKKGSNGFRKSQTHRKNYINWSINQLNFSEVKTINLERLFQMGKGTNKGRFLSGFAYTLIKEKLISVSESEGFVIIEISNEFRSQRCSECGWTQKSNRRRKVFECKKCRFSTDADLNASFNLLRDDLPVVPKWVREERRNLKGFYWNLSGLSDSSGELIVPHVQENIQSEILL
jgi:putative transposase